MDSELVSRLTMYILMKRMRRRRRPVVERRWSREWILKRDEFSHINLINQLRLTDPNDFRNYLRMDETAYTHLLQLVTPLIQKQDTVMRKSISAHERLTATLRFLATGRTYTDLQFTVAIPKSTLSGIIRETCFAIYNVLSPDYLKFPTTPEEWLNIARDFEEQWQFPNCLGAVDGKHIAIIPPTGSGSFFYNYKNFHSIVLMAIVNASYEFVMCDIGVNGRNSDGGVIGRTEFYAKLLTKNLQLPAARRMPVSKRSLNYVFISDEAFALREDFLKPYSKRELDHDKRIFNYRLSRARRVVENAFGILSKRFQVFRTPIAVKVNTIKLITLTCCVLHNWLRATSKNYVTVEELHTEDTNRGTVQRNPEFDQHELVRLQRGRSRNPDVVGKIARDAFKSYFNNEGAVSWQEQCIAHNIYYSSDESENE